VASGAARGEGGGAHSWRSGGKDSILLEPLAADRVVESNGPINCRKSLGWLLSQNPNDLRDEPARLACPSPEAADLGAARSFPLGR
jgi:hypothetical protein